jgi:hypothetical protein
VQGGWRLQTSGNVSVPPLVSCSTCCLQLHLHCFCVMATGDTPSTECGVSRCPH